MNEREREREREREGGKFKVSHDRSSVLFSAIYALNISFVDIAIIYIIQI